MTSGPPPSRRRSPAAARRSCSPEAATSTGLVRTTAGRGATAAEHVAHNARDGPATSGARRTQQEVDGGGREVHPATLAQVDFRQRGSVGAMWTRDRAQSPVDSPEKRRSSIRRHEPSGGRCQSRRRASSAQRAESSPVRPASTLASTSGSSGPPPVSPPSSVGAVERDVVQLDAGVARTEEPEAGGGDPVDGVGVGHADRQPSRVTERRHPIVLVAPHRSHVEGRAASVARP